MAFPITIDTTVGGAEQPGKFSTFFHGADRYQIQFLLDGPGNQFFLLAEKSTDGGATWAEVDAAHRPVGLFGGPGVPYTCCQSSVAGLHVIYLDVGAADVAIIGFNMAADTWGLAPLATVTPPQGAYPQTADGFLLGQYCCGFRPGTNDILFVLAGDFVLLNEVFHEICWLAIFDIGAATWTVIGDLGFQDYPDITTWDLVPCGLAVDPVTGIATVVMQQVARAGPGDVAVVPITLTGASVFTVPLDAGPVAKIEAWGAGAGPSGAGPAACGGGGAAAYSRLNAFAWTPGANFNINVGLGGAPVTDGGDTSFNTVGTLLAKGGKTGASVGLGGLGGLATAGVGDSKQNGGNGGAATLGGGGGGGAGGNGADGLPGGPGGVGMNPPGGPGGLGGPGGGNGGGGGALNFTGTGGNSPGSGAGGCGDASPIDLANPKGTDGQLTITYTTVRNTHACGMWQQAILPDNSLGALTEIPEGAYPSRAKGAAPVPISFDMAAKGGKVWITLTGATFTADRDNIAVGQGSSAAPVNFAFQVFTCGNGGNNVDSCPAIALGTGVAYCCYISAPGAVNFVYRARPGAVFGFPFLIGTLTAPDIREFGRLQASVLVTLPEITFGTPTAASVTFDTPG